jgi:hypothetical protein
MYQLLLVPAHVYHSEERGIPCFFQSMSEEGRETCIPGYLAFASAPAYWRLLPIESQSSSTL